MLTKMGPVAALGAAVGLTLGSGCAALFSPALLGPNKCLGAHQPSGAWTPTELSAQGLTYLDLAVSSPTLSAPAERAAACFIRAQQLSADDYGSNLGLGIAYLAQAKVTSQKGDKIKTHDLLANAKKSLGTAYFVSQGQLEPVYYLAEVAVIEGTPGSLAVAKNLLLALDKVGYKRGPVYVLLGFMSEKANDKERAKSYYAAAVQQNYPAASAQYAEDKYRAKEKK